MSERSQAAIERIEKTVPVLEILRHYGYPVRLDGGSREQQFPCDLHGTGRDSKPSARVYPDSNSWYCFACGKTRTIIETVRVKEDLSFWGAVDHLEKMYGLEALPRDYEAPDSQDRAVRAVQNALNPEVSFENQVAHTRRFLDNRTQSKDLALPDLLRFWEKFDQILYLVQETRENRLTEEQGCRLLKGLLEMVRKAMS